MSLSQDALTCWTVGAGIPTVFPSPTSSSFNHLWTRRQVTQTGLDPKWAINQFPAECCLTLFIDFSKAFHTVGSCYSNETDLPLGTFPTTWVGRPVLHFRDVWKRHIKPGNINQAGLQAAVPDSWGSTIKMCIPKKRRKEGSSCGTRGKGADNDDKDCRQPRQRCRTHLLYTCRNSSRNCHSGIGLFSQAGDTNPTIDC